MGEPKRVVETIDGQHYRELASWLRGIARQCRLPGARQELLDLALRYEARANHHARRRGRFHQRDLGLTLLETRRPAPSRRQRLRYNADSFPLSGHSIGAARIGPLWVRTFPSRGESGKVRKRRNLAIGAQRPMRCIHVETYRTVNWRAASPAVWERYGRDRGGDLHIAPIARSLQPAPGHKDRLIGLKCPLKPKDVWAIRIWLQPQGRK